ncbi:MAG: sulfurtransferase TusA family protein [Deltaproteobacteria bacterium]|jgi:TusA-related sulfurtransferase|nr:sulfurtransferase TusA family protein [Deltaproteobacteria bacterium]
MAVAVDARGLNCPQPLMMVMEAMKKDPGPLTVLVDSESAVESIARNLKREKRTLDISRSGSDVTLNIGPK